MTVSTDAVRADSGIVLQTQAIRPYALGWLLASLTLAMLPHAARMSLWVTALVACCALWRGLCALRGWSLPGALVRLAFVAAVVAGIVLSYGAPVGRTAGVAFLMSLLGLKLLEMRTRRDAMLVLYLGYFLVLTNFLHDQSIPMALYMLAAVLFMTAALITVNHHADAAARQWQTNLKLASKLILQALPLMLVLFVFFPRVAGPLWRLPEDARGGKTGLSEEMSPGRISQLNQSDEIAMRVKFDGQVPDPRQLYWRGPVLWDFDGYVWSTERPLDDEALPLWPHGPPVTYTITLEAHDRPWLFVLDLPHSFLAENGETYVLDHAGDIPGTGKLTSDFQLRAETYIKSTKRYRVTSYTQYGTGRLSAAMRRRATQLPPTISARIKALAREWRGQSQSDQAIVNKALAHFNQQPFVYTLTPPPLDNHPTDGFLFDTRRGYCEHYSSAFTVLMRAAGVPARVVTGYQGGEINSVGNYLTVRQLDAHAWSEVWLKGRGWVRVDPTAAVAPERIEIGAEALPWISTTPLAFQQSAALTRLWQQLRQRWDAIGNAWNQWVLNYGARQQSRLFERFGLENISWRGLTIGLVIALNVIILLIAWSLFRQRRIERDPVVKAWRRFCKKLARKGIAVSPHEGPADFARRVGVLRPDLRPRVSLISRLYIALRYSARAQAGWLAKLQQSVRSFNP